MILQDHKQKKGIFFIDPHGEAIDQLVTRANSAVCPFTVFDFEDDWTTLTINPLGTDDFTDPSLRNEAFAKTKALFDKLWKNTFEEKPWLQLILQNTIYTFIENQEYRLTEFPMFFSDRDFRHHLVQNIRHNIQVKHYWQHALASKDKRDQESILETAQTRCEIMLAHPAVRHLFGSYYYRDFGDFLTYRRGFFVKLSTRLPYEIKKIIGTALLNELIFAVQKRKPGSDLFCIYIDEFQNFVSFEDMATLITQAPKFGISATLAHHDA